jgi:hypothetical protein
MQGSDAHGFLPSPQAALTKRPIRRPTGGSPGRSLRTLFAPFCHFLLLDLSIWAAGERSQFLSGEIKHSVRCRRLCRAIIALIYSGFTRG